MTIHELWRRLASTIDMKWCFVGTFGDIIFITGGGLQEKGVL